MCMSLTCVEGERERDVESEGEEREQGEREGSDRCQSNMCVDIISVLILEWCHCLVGAEGWGIFT